MKQRIEVFGFLDPALALPSPARLRGLPAVPVSRLLSHPASSFRALRHPCRVSRATAGPDITSELPSLGFLPSSRHHFAESTGAGIPGRHRSVLDVSHVLDGFLLHETSRVCFTPQPRPGFALQGFPPVRSRTSSSLADALMSLRETPYSQFDPSAPGISRPPSGPCSAHWSVAARSGLDRALLHPLLSFLLPRVFLHKPSEQPSSPLPTTAFRGPRRVASLRPGLLLRARLPRPRFSTCCLYRLAPTRAARPRQIGRAHV